MTLQKVLRFAVISGLFIIPFVVLFVSSSLFFPFITGKNFAFRILVELVAGAWILLALMSPEYRPKRNALFYSVIAFALVVLVADVFGKYAFKSLWSNYERMEGYVTIAHLVLYFMAAFSVLRQKLWERLLQTNLFVSFIIALYGFVQLGGGAQIHQGGTRLDATLGNATYLAVYMLFNIFFAFVMIFRRKDLFSRTIYGASALINMVILYHTATRGALLGLIAGLSIAALLIAIFEKERKQLRWIAAGIVTCAVLIVGSFLVMKQVGFPAFVTNSPVLGRFTSISLSERTTQSRFLIWNMAFQGFKESPKTMIIGWGQENFNYVFNKYYDPKMYNQEQWFDRTHNVVLDWLIAGGILGFVSYLALYVAGLYYLWRRTTFTFVEKSLWTGLFVGYIVHNLFVFDNLISYILFFTTLAYIAGSSEPLRKSEQREHLNTWALRGTSVQAALPIAIIATLVVLYFVNIPPILASRELIKGISPSQESVSQRLGHFKKATGYGTFANPEIREQLVSVYTNIAPQSGLAEADRKAFFEFTKAQIDDQVSRTPEDSRYQLFAGTFYTAVGAFPDAIAHYELARKYSPRKQQIMFELGAAYLNNKEYDKALEVLKTAYDSAPEYEEARFIYAIGAIYAGKNELAAELEKGLSAEKLSDPRFISAYSASKQYGKLRDIFEKKIKENPTDIQLRISLTAVYLQLNLRTQAIAMLQEIGKINPEFKDTADEYIRQIKAGKNPAAAQ